MSDDHPLASPAWDELRVHTPARVALGRVGHSLPCAEVLRFGLAHAQARDAVHRPFDAAGMARRLADAGFRVLRARSEAGDRATYLLRPDLGRSLHPDSRADLAARAAAPGLAIVVGDGLSSIAVERHALPLLEALRERFGTPWAQVPVVVAERARVALGDGIGEALRADLVVVLIGERPGLSSPDSLGAYLTYQPRVGRMDSERNCISNIRPEGLAYGQAAHKARFLMEQALHLGFTGIGLKDDSDLKGIAADAP